MDSIKYLNLLLSIDMTCKISKLIQVCNKVVIAIWCKCPKHKKKSSMDPSSMGPCPRLATIHLGPSLTIKVMDQKHPNILHMPIRT